MIKDFFFVISCPCIKNTDCFAKKQGQLLLNILCFPLKKSTVDFLRRHPVICNHLFKPFSDLEDKNFTYFFIWNDESVSSIRFTACLCKISCRKQYTPHIVYPLIDLIIRQIQTNSLFYCISRDQLLNFISGRCVGLFNQPFYKIISAAVDPIGFGLYIWITQ